MSSRPPPLTWLRAFEAAGRLQSFRAAAAELHVTPSAVSHHVRALERHLARPLFQRTANSVRLTREGTAYLARLSIGFEHLARAGEVFTEPRPARLTIGAFPFLVSEMLLPGLDDLRRRLPGVAISVVSGTHLELLTHEDPQRRADALIRYGDGRFPGHRARKLTDVSLVPVVAAGGAARDTLPGDRESMAARPRIMVSGPFDGWSAWSAATGVPLSGEVISFDNYLSAMHAVEQGLGVGLGVRPFIDPWLAAGRVVVAMAASVPVSRASYLVTAGHDDRRELDILAEWLAGRFATAGQVRPERERPG